MKTSNLKKGLGVIVFFLGLLFIVNCSSDDSSNSDAQQSTITVTGSIVSFGEVDVESSSASQSVTVKGVRLSSDLSISVTSNFEISLDDVNFVNQLTINKSDANGSSHILYVRFSPSTSAVGPLAGSVSIESDSATTRTLNLNGVGLSITPLITLNTMSIDFEDTQMLANSASSTLVVNGDNLSTAIDVTTTESFEVSLDGTIYSEAVQIPSESANDQTTVFVRFSPTAIGSVTGTLSVANAEAENVEVSLTGTGTPIIHNYTTFNDEPIAFGTGFSQSAEQTFMLHSDISNISQIKMYLQIDCPATGCDDWDRYANVMVRDTDSGNWYEIGRYITPYWVGTELLPRGLEFDVTDFKSLLTGNVDIRIYIENWTTKADLISIDFDYIEGTPDYQYYAVAEVMQYNGNSLQGVPYGVDNTFDLTRSVAVPANSESTHLRTVISGWGHATPNDSDGRPCAEWCYRTHDVKINGAIMFQHDLAPIGCATNPINNQSPGNWQPDRAGWCPGMVVPARIDQFGSTMAGSSFSFEYDYEDWVNNLAGGDAFYATSTFVVVKSNTPINKPIVTN
jgi:hypothetical protein